MVWQAAVASSGVASRMIIEPSFPMPRRLAMQNKPRSRGRPMYRIRQIDGQDDEVIDMLAELHRLTFFDSAPIPEFDQGDWWLALHEAVPVGFAGVVPSTRADNAGYFSRVGVLKRHCGRGLQLRMMRAIEARARSYR